MILSLLMIVVSFVILYFGAEFALDGGERIGQKLKMSPLVIGLVIIGFGTSLPEFFVSHIASLKGNYSLALGNILGSNIANVLLILGISSFILPLSMKGKEIKLQLMFHLVVTIASFFLLRLGEISWVSLGVYFCFMVLYLFLVIKGKKQTSELTPVDCRGIHIFKLLAGFLMLYFGGEWLVQYGGEFCRLLGVSEYLISAILIAFGTSFPELMTSIIASVKGKSSDVIVGNILGSNVFNLCTVLGSLGIYQFKISQDLTVETSVMVFIALVLMYLGYREKNLNRFFGLFALGGYAAMVFYWVKSAV